MNILLDNGIENTNKKFDVKPIIFLIGLYIIENLIPIFFINFETKEYIIPGSYLWLISKIIPLIVVFVFYKKKLFSEAKETRSNFKYFMIYSLLAFLVFYLFEISASYYQMFIDKILHTGEATNQEEIYEYFYSSKTFINYFVLFITIVILAPLLEEFAFREMLFKVFPKSHFLVPTLVSAFLFGFMHLQLLTVDDAGQLAFNFLEFAYFPIYFIPGFALGLAYHYSNNNLYSSFFIHLTSNLISYIVIIFKILGE